jgi:hypothetical protein
MHITKPEENRITKTYVLEILNFEDMNLTVGKEVFLILKLRRIRVYENRDTPMTNYNSG